MSVSNLGDSRLVVCGVAGLGSGLQGNLDRRNDFTHRFDVETLLGGVVVHWLRYGLAEGGLQQAPIGFQHIQLLRQSGRSAADATNLQA